MPGINEVRWGIRPIWWSGLGTTNTTCSSRQSLNRSLWQQDLVAAEFLYQHGLPPQATYLFKHALIQDAAYQSLLRSTRQQHHQHICFGAMTLWLLGYP